MASDGTTAEIDNPAITMAEADTGTGITVVGTIDTTTTEIGIVIRYLTFEANRVDRTESIKDFNSRLT